MIRWLEAIRSKFKPARGGPFVALDLDRRWLHVVYAVPQGKLPQIRKLAAIEVPAALDPADPQAVGQFVGKSLRDLRLTGHRVAMDVPRSRALLKTVTLPPIEDERELPGMVRYQVEKELPFAMSEAVIDFTVESHVDASNGKSPDDDETARGKTVLVAAVRRSVVEYYHAVAEAAQIDLQQLGLRPYADLHCLRACLSTTAATDVVLIHLTADEAEIGVVLNGSLAFSRSASLAIPHNEGGKPLADSPVDGLVIEVVRTVQSVRAAQHGSQIGRVWIAGDTGHEGAVAQALRKRLSTTCEVLKPFELLKSNKPTDGDSGYITALGLAIGHTGHGLPLDFLHPKEPPVERDMRKVTAVYTAIAVAAIIIVALAIGLFNRSAAARHLQALEGHRDELLDAVKPVRKLEGNMKAIDVWLNADRKWLDHWANISAAMPPAPEAYITSLRTTSEGLISLTLKARGSSVITEASRRLREAGYDVKLSAETTVEDEYGYRFTNELRLTPRTEPKIENLVTAPRPADDGSAELIRTSGRRGGQ